jgi:PAS domain S-box-containing protein
VRPRRVPKFPRALARPETDAPAERPDRFRRLYEAARSFVFRLSPDGRLRELVPAPENLMGRPLADWMGADFLQFMAEADASRAREMLARVVAGEMPSPFVVRFRTPSGDLRHVEFTVVPDEQDGRVVGVVGLANGVTLRREAEAKAAHLERLLLSSQQIAHVGSWEWNTETGDVVWSDELYRIFGLDPQKDKITIERLLAPLPPEEKARAQGQARGSVEEGRPFIFDHEIVRPDGRVRTLEVRGEAVRDERGRVCGLIGTCQDVTERREREELIQAYLEVGENIPIALTIWELAPGDPPHPVLVQFNRRAKELGARKEMLGRMLRDLLPQVYETELPALLVNVARTGQVRMIDRITLGDRVYATRIFPVRGRRVGLAFDDVTEHVQAQTALQEAKEELQQLVESVQAIVWRADPRNGRFTFVSREAEALLGYPVKRWLDEPAFWADHLHPEDREWATSFHTRALEQARDHAFEFRMIAAGGQVVWLRDVVRVIAHGGAARECVGVMFNVTSRREAEEDLRRSQRQLSDLSAHVEWAREEERRTISREIHDELGQALTALKMDLALLRSKLRVGGAGVAPEVLGERLEGMSKLTEDTIERVRRLARELRPGVLDDLGLEAAIEWQAQDFEARSGIACRVHSRLGDLKLPWPLSTAFFRTFQESLTNVARHAHARRVEVFLGHKGNRLTLEVSDNGRGISEEAVAGAKSLGLLGMRERARRLGGQFAISGGLGRGTTVTLSVPLPDDEIPSQLPVPRDPA